LFIRYLDKKESSTLATPSGDGFTIHDEVFTGQGLKRGDSRQVTVKILDRRSNRLKGEIIDGTVLDWPTGSQVTVTVPRDGTPADVKHFNIKTGWDLKYFND
jgi:hypothetical protein